MKTERDLAAVALALIGPNAWLSPAEQALSQELSERAPADAGLVRALQSTILRGGDPLGHAFQSLRSAQTRRQTGAVYTPAAIVESMLLWVKRQQRPQRVVDPGAGSGRFLLAAAQAMPAAQLIGIETDPLAALTLRANLAVHGYQHRCTVLVQDYRNVELTDIAGRTAFIGNPPYLRHHDIDEFWKAWYAEEFAGLGIKASALAGLHLHFFLKTLLLARDGDIGAFVTSAEWLDVNYGASLRKLFVDRLGGMSLHVLEPTVEAFPGTATTAAISCFQVGRSTPSVQLRSVASVDELKALTLGESVARERLLNTPRWSILVRPSVEAPGYRDGIELGEIFRVHRGQVTGANNVWIAGEQAMNLPERLRIPAVTKARDLIEAGARLTRTDRLRRVVDLPPELDQLSADERRCVEVFLRWARDAGAPDGYIARHRKAWWSVGLKAPAPILCTYMARRPPQFTLNSCQARHINIAHGLYPREDLSQRVLARLVGWLNENVSTGSGRTYAGGLTKFEPKEIERLHIPPLESICA